MGRPMGCPVLWKRYSSGPNNSVVLNKHGGWTIFPKLINVWSGISVWSVFSCNLAMHHQQKHHYFFPKTKDYYILEMIKSKSFIKPLMFQGFMRNFHVGWNFS
jgi:hypothetical protein